MSHSKGANANANAAASPDNVPGPANEETSINKKVTPIDPKAASETKSPPSIVGDAPPQIDPDNGLVRRKPAWSIREGLERRQAEYEKMTPEEKARAKPDNGVSADIAMDFLMEEFGSN